MEFQDVFGHTIHLTEERWEHIVDEHPEVLFAPKCIQEVLRKPRSIVRSVYDPEVILYYRFYPNLWNGKYIVVIVKKNHRQFVLTAYVTDHIKGGKVIWQSD